MRVKSHSRINAMNSLKPLASNYIRTTLALSEFNARKCAEQWNRPKNLPVKIYHLIRYNYIYMYTRCEIIQKMAAKKLDTVIQKAWADAVKSLTSVLLLSTNDFNIETTSSQTSHSSETFGTDMETRLNEGHMLVCLQNSSLFWGEREIERI